MATVALRNVSKRFGHVEALRTVSLDVASGEFVTLLGPSGCGKSTTLRIIAGLTTPDSGEVRIGDRDVTHLPTFRRRIGMVFQSLALFPHLTVGENIAFGLEMRKFEPGNETALVRRALETVRLSGYEERYPSQLSGGQQQRVALARAVVFNPDVVLLDEPLAALDRNLREAMQTELRELTRRIGITSIFVTHDQEEALILSDRIAVMNDGVIEQFGPPAEVFDAPKTRYVADFMGVVNFCEATVGEIAGGEAVLDAGGCEFGLGRYPDSRPGLASTLRFDPNASSLPRAGPLRLSTHSSAWSNPTSSTVRSLPIGYACQGRRMCGWSLAR